MDHYHGRSSRIRHEKVHVAHPGGGLTMTIYIYIYIYIAARLLIEVQTAIDSLSLPFI